MNKSVSYKGKTFPMHSKSVNFTDGMIVTADDLSAAMAYPVALMQSVNRAIFGCGVVCGFELKPDPGLCDRIESCDPCVDGSKRAYPGFTVEIGRGMALDCHGLPVELCEPVRVDLGDRKCGCDMQEGRVCIFIRRISSPEAPRGDCCTSTDAQTQCSRLQDHVEIRAFPVNEVPEHACMHPFDTEGVSGCGGGNGQDDGSAGKTKTTRYPNDMERCACLGLCPDCHCCGEGWILLGCLELCKGGIVVESFENATVNRKMIKMIECFCRMVEDDSAVAEEAGDDAEANEPVTPMTADEADPEFIGLLHEIIEDDRRENIILLAGVRKLEDLIVILQPDQPQLQKAFGVKSPQVIEEYRGKVNDLLKAREG